MTGIIEKYLLDTSEDSTDCLDDLNTQQTDQLDDNDLITLEEKLQKVHVGFLFYRENLHKDEVAQICKDVYERLAEMLLCTPVTDRLAGWQMVACHLELDNDKIIEYIQHGLSTRCPVELMLQTFAQRDTSTLDKVIRALRLIPRLDILHEINKPLLMLSEILEEDILKTNDDIGYFSAELNGIIRPKLINFDLPKGLQENGFQNSWHITNPAVLLTFAADGLRIAERIMSKHGDKINIVTLERKKQDFLMNSDNYLRHCFEQVDYVMPILTDGYIDIIKSTSLVPTSCGNLDYTNVKPIYTAVNLEYQANGCRNRKVRSILPDNYILSSSHRLYECPILTAVFAESRLSREFETIIRKYT